MTPLIVHKSGVLLTALSSKKDEPGNLIDFNEVILLTPSTLLSNPCNLLFSLEFSTIEIVTL